MLHLLSAQAALSIHNAVLYGRLEDHSRTLEQKVEARTREFVEKNEALDRTLNQLRKTQQQLITREKLASLGALTAGIAHELKNPLNFVNNFAQLSEELTGDIKACVETQRVRLGPGVVGELKEMLELLSQNTTRIHEHAKKASRIIDGMVMHSLETAGTRENADLNMIVAKSVGLACHAIRGKYSNLNVAIEAAYDPNIGLVELVASDISRVFINLVNNACYAVHQKRNEVGSAYTPTLWVRTSDRGIHAEVRIRDNGTGIPAAHLGLVFNPFFTTKPTGEGTGLGLSLSHQIITGGIKASCAWNQWKASSPSSSSPCRSAPCRESPSSRGDLSVEQL